VAGVHSMLSNQFADKADPTATTYGGLDSFAYVFTLDNVVDANAGVGDATMFYRSGSRADGTSYTALSGKTYKDLIDAGFNNFTAPMWGGFDGFNIKLPDPLYNYGMDEGTEKTSAAYYTIKRAIDTVADPEVVETNLLAMPGLTNTSLTQHMINVCEERADALAVIDLPSVYLPAAEGQYSTKSTKASRIATTPTAAATALRDRRINSSYGCTFYPWVQTRDERTGAAVWLPPSAAMLGVLASSERKAQLWFAPAGFNRGGLSDGAAGIPVSSVTEKLTSKQRDLLYEANINPIASFPSTGIVVFGQKTLQEGQSALDRINVRRLVIYLKKEISRISTQILFEQNVQATWNRFIGLVEPFLANVKSNFGISDYKLILDESTTTPDLIDQNIMYAKIMVKPARAIEYIAIDFVIASTGASFDD
ncbi:MAG: phage tail sheath C-terminal domain-containing protein, partial [Betaproteobacteria bacterium]